MAGGKLEEKVSAFERQFEYAATVARRDRGGGQMEHEALSALRATLRRTEEDAAAAYAQRDVLLTQLRDINQRVQRRYHESAQPFLDSFRRLAGGFLGMPVDVALRPREANQVTLEFTLNREPRRREHNLSESQRFFVDIALRMSFARFISAPDEPVTLLIDTPEGSLDIAYEQRAGEMFAAFAQENNILMTANVNTSRLLIALADRSGPERMTLVRMTDWAELNSVQSENEGLFQSAYEQIAKHLAHPLGA
jgi:hypothetical protein